MSQNSIIKSQSKKIIVIRKDRSSSAASSTHSKSSSIQKHYPTHPISYNNHNQTQESTYSNKQFRNNQDKQLQKLQSHILSNQLSLIQNQILDLRLQITRQISQKYELQKQLNIVLEEQHSFFNTIYHEINKNFFIKQQQKSNEENSSEKKIQKISGVDFNQLASQIIFLYKSNQLNEQVLKSKQNYISGLKDENSSLRKKISKLINEVKIIPQKKTIQSQTQITDVQQISISTIKHFSFNEVINNVQKINAQVQTDQKRIGLALTIQNIRQNQKLGYNNNSRVSPYRHYLQSPQKQSRITISKQRKYQNVGANPKKINLQSIKDKRLNQNQKNQKKKIIASTPYINHLLLQSKQITIEETTTIQGNQQTRLNIRLQNPKSQLSYRRPIHRSRSHSQQEIPSTAQRAQRSKSNYSSSRKLSGGFSINPLNKYGQKRLCNQVNGKKIRKISRLSQQSEQLQERMKQLEQEQKKLNQKYNLLAQMKLVKSVPINRSRSKCNPTNYNY